MKYDNERSLQEIMKRGKALAVRKHKRIAVLTGTLSGFLMCLIAAVFYGETHFSGSEMFSSNYGAFLLSREAGMYVFLGVVFFVLGVGVSLGIMKIMDNKKWAEKEEKTDDKTS